jgi:hypothetical protein
MADYVWTLEFELADEFNEVYSAYQTTHATREAAMAQLVFNIRETAGAGIINYSTNDEHENAVMDELHCAGVPVWDVEEYSGGLELAAASMYEDPPQMCAEFVQPDYDDARVLIVIRRELVRP